MLLFFAFIPILDAVSIFWGFGFGGKESMPIALWFMSVLGELGLIIEALLFVCFILLLRQGMLKLRLTCDFRIKKDVLLFFLVFLIFTGVMENWFGIVVRNFLYPLRSSDIQNVIIYIVALLGFVLGILWFTRKEFKEKKD